MNGVLMMAELKPCPFCGSISTYYARRQVRADIFDLNQKIWKLYCTQCGASTDYFKTTKEAIEAWNRRVDPIQANDYEIVLGGFHNG